MRSPVRGLLRRIRHRKLTQQFRATLELAATAIETERALADEFYTIGLSDMPRRIQIVRMRLRMRYLIAWLTAECERLDGELTALEAEQDGR